MSEVPVVYVGDGAAELDFNFPAGAYVNQDIVFLNADGTDYSWGSVTGKAEIHRRPSTPTLLSFTTGGSTMLLVTGKMTLVGTMPSTPVNGRWSAYTIDGSGHRTRRAYGQWDIDREVTT